VPIFISSKEPVDLERSAKRGGEQVAAAHDATRSITKECSGGEAITTHHHQSRVFFSVDNHPIIQSSRGLLKIIDKGLQLLRSSPPPLVIFTRSSNITQEFIIICSTHKISQTAVISCDVIT